MGDEKLGWVYGNVVFQLGRRYGEVDVGTSELEWMRNAIVAELEARGLPVPEVDWTCMCRIEVV